MLTWKLPNETIHESHVRSFNGDMRQVKFDHLFPKTITSIIFDGGDEVPSRVTTFEIRNSQEKSVHRYLG